MMSVQHFRTEIKLNKSRITLHHTNTILSVGSCFSEHIQDKMKSAGFNTRCNPNGIVYNPVSIGVQVMSLLQHRVWNEEDIIFNQGLYHGLHHHGRFSAPSPDKVLDTMNATAKIEEAHLSRVDRMIVTFGSAISYTHIAKGHLVANCHKVPTNQFDRKILTVEEMMHSSNQWIETLHRANCNLQIILTLSPVRYLREGFTDNTLSKARLYLVIQALCRQYDFIDYFPSYEIMLDDLRDYRFYKKDMIHPTDQAVDYIWDKFSTVYFDETTIAIKEKIEKINQKKAHRPLHPETADHLKFNLKLEEEIKLLKKEYPWIE